MLTVGKDAAGTVSRPAGVGNASGSVRAGPAWPDGAAAQVAVRWL